MIEIREGDWVECEGGFCLSAKVEKVFFDSFEASFFVESINGEKYIFLGSFCWKKKRISHRIKNKKTISKLEESHDIVRA